MKYITYVGSYTDATHREGIHIMESDADTGDFRMLRVIDTLSNPTYMALNRDCTRLYTVQNRASFGPRGRDGGLAAFAVRGDRLEPMNEIPTGWTAPCYIALDPSEQAVVYAEYSCGTAGYANLAADGSLDPAFSGVQGGLNARCQVRHVGEGPSKPRQDRAHAHCAVVTPDGKFMMVVDLTLDEIKAYDFANRADGLKEVPSATIRTSPKGAGPRHIVFHPNGRLAFVVFELENLVASYRYTGQGFEHVETHSLLPKGFSGFSKAAAIRLSEDGTQVFCSNRGHDSIAVFNVDPATGQMEFLAINTLGGQFPRDFAFMPGGRFCLVGLKESWRLASFAYDRRSGVFTPVATMNGIFRPLFFAFKTA